MTRDKLGAQISAALAEVAPEISHEHLDPQASFRDQADFDSVDFLNYVLALERRLGVRIPEADYPRLSSLNGALAYLQEARKADV